MTNHEKKITHDDVKLLLKEDPDFIFSKKFDFSLKNLLERYPEGVSNKMIAKVLLMSEIDVNKTLTDVLTKIRKRLKIEVNHKTKEVIDDWERS